MIMMHMNFYFDIMYDYYRAAITYIQYPFTFIAVPKQYYLTLYVYISLGYIRFDPNKNCNRMSVKLIICVK